MSSAKDYMNIVEVLSQLSEASKKVVGQINFDGMMSALKIVAEQLKPLESLQGNLNSALKVMQVQMNMQPVISEMMNQRYIAAQIFSNGEVARQLANVQSAAAVMASLPTATQMLKDVQLGLANSDITTCVSAIQKSLDSTSIAMSDVSFIKTADLMNSIKSELVMPVGLASVISELNKSSVERLKHNNNIVYIMGKMVHTPDFKGYIGIMDIDKVSEKQIWRYNGKDLVVCDNGFQWLTIMPKDEFFCITVMMDSHRNIQVCYIDMLDSHGIDDDGVPYFMDSYLDLVVYPDGTIIVDDKEELDKALETNDITEEQYLKTINTAQSLQDGLLKDKMTFSDYIEKAMLSFDETKIE